MSITELKQKEISVVSGGDFLNFFVQEALVVGFVIYTRWKSHEDYPMDGFSKELGAVGDFLNWANKLMHVCGEPRNLKKIFYAAVAFATIQYGFNIIAGLVRYLF